MGGENKNLNKSNLTRAASLSLLLVPLLILIPAASASTSAKGSGTFTATITSETIVYSNGGTTLYSFSGPDVLTGIETGTAQATFSMLVLPSGHDIGAGNFVCTSCTFNGQTGTFTVQFTFQGTFGGSGTGQGQL